jgi:hypothetical protein
MMTSGTMTKAATNGTVDNSVNSKARRCAAAAPASSGEAVRSKRLAFDLPDSVPASAGYLFLMAP